MSEKFRLRPLHRQRQGRRKPVRVLNQDELCELLGVGLPALRTRLDELRWRYHCDGAGDLWATDQSSGGITRGK